jgi:putative flippase GtrA
MGIEKKYLLTLAALILFVVFLLTGMMIFIPIPESGREHAKYALAFILGVASTIITYFWGSSKGSADKSEIIGRTDK